jgi:hypothetical protein
VSAWVFPEGRELVAVEHPNVRRAVLRDAFRYATLEEYARAAGVGVDVVTDELGPALDAGAASLEVTHGEIFLLTAPGGRPVPAHVPDIAPNLWEVLRYGRSIEQAWELWRLHRALERAGWEVLAVPGEVHASLRGALSRPAPLALRVGAASVPVLVFPDDADVADSSGMLGELDRAGAPAVAVVCAQSALDRVVTAVRRYALGARMVEMRCAVLVLEAPRFQPVLLKAGDTSVAPVSVTRSMLASLAWGEAH